MDFNNKIVLVTGGTSGIGKEIAKQLLMQGATVIINYGHNEEQKHLASEELKEYENKILFVKSDISNEDDVRNMFEIINKRYKKLDYLVNNAGTNIDEMIEDANLENYMKVINTNFIGKMLCTKYAIPLMKNGNGSSIVNVASGLGIKPCEMSSAYCAASAAIINFTKASAIELSKYKIRVNSICPGFTPTPLSLDSWSEEEINHKKEINPLGRLGTPVDMANAVLFLLSDMASYINGENISINGGSKLI